MKISKPTTSHILLHHLNENYCQLLIFFLHDIKTGKTKDNKLLDMQTCWNRQTWRVCCSWFLQVKSKLRIKFAYLVFNIFDVNPLPKYSRAIRWKTEASWLVGGVQFTEKSREAWTFASTNKITGLESIC